MANSALSNPEPAVSDATASKSSFLPMLLVGVLSTTIASGAVLGIGYWLLRSGKLTSASASAKEAGAGEHAVHAVSASDAVPTHVMPLEPMVVNLADAGGRAYLRASISLRMADEASGKGEKAEGKADAVSTASKAAPLRDTTLAVLGEQSSDALLAAEGVAAVKKRLRERYAIANPEVHVLDVYFTDFLVQRG